MIIGSARGGLGARGVLGCVAVILVFSAANGAAGCAGNGCESTEARGTAGLVEDVYVWQRHHGATVRAALTRLIGEVPESGPPPPRRVLLLASELKVRDCAVTEHAVDYAADVLKEAPVAVVVRLGPLRLDRCPAGAIEKAKSSVVRALRRAQSKGLRVQEVQLDYDAPTRVLPLYAKVLRELRGELAAPAGQGVAVTITSLPTWLDADDFADVAAVVDSHTLQVHGLRSPSSWSSAHREGARLLFDVKAARAAIEKAGELARPFAVSLPTYGYELGFDGERFLGLKADAPAAAWPAGSRSLAVAADPMAVGRLFNALQVRRPANLTAIRWFRMPIDGERLNWDAATFDAVRRGTAAGPTVERDTEQGAAGKRLDVYVTNVGDVVARFPDRVVGGPGFAAEGSEGYRAERDGTRWTFRREEAVGGPVWMKPGERRNVGWVVRQ